MYPWGYTGLREEATVSNSAWDQRYAGTDLVWSTTPNQWVEQIAGGLAPGRVLDLAGGEGRNALWLADRGWHATVVDFSRVALDRAGALAVQRFGAEDQRLVTVQADLLTYRPEPASFDLVLVVYLHLVAEARRTVLRLAATAVAPSGHLLVVAHDATNLTAGVGGPQDSRVLYACADVEADLAGSGLVIERSGTVLRAVETENGPRHAVDALLLAIRPGETTTLTRTTQS
jgi:SAM-dependent methyltransferase